MPFGRAKNFSADKKRGLRGFTPMLSDHVPIRGNTNGRRFSLIPACVNIDPGLTPTSPALSPRATGVAQLRNEFVPSKPRKCRDPRQSAARTFWLRFRSLRYFRPAFRRFSCKPLIRLIRSFRTCVTTVGLGGEGQGEVGPTISATPDQSNCGVDPHLTQPLRPKGGEGRGDGVVRLWATPRRRSRGAASPGNDFQCGARVTTRSA